ncbi:hypothetical protein DRN38_00170 [Thermococci archaeon]|nr:MAG: hypothetical protein DRN38_00170 [Thermococci archaeon]
MSIDFIIKKLQREKRVRDAFLLLKAIYENRIMKFTDIIEMKDVDRSRGLLRIFCNNDILRRITIYRAGGQSTAYIITEKGYKLLKELSKILGEPIVQSNPKIITFTNKEWILIALARLARRGIYKVTKGMIFKEIMNIIRLNESKGNKVIHPKITSLDRVIRKLVEEGILIREGSHRNPRYIINLEHVIVEV